MGDSKKKYESDLGSQRVISLRYSFEYQNTKQTLRKEKTEQNEEK